MALSNLSLAFLVKEMAPLIKDSYLNRVQEISSNTLKFRIRTTKGTRDLIFAPNAVYFTNFKISALKQTSGFGAFLRKRLENKKIASFSQHGLDRVVVLEFTDFYLIAELFAKGNLILTDKEFEILSAYRKENWKDRELRKGTPYKFPSSGKLNPLKLSAKELQKVFSTSSADVVRTLVKGLDIAPEAAEEILYRLELDKTAGAESLSLKNIEAILSQLKSLYSLTEKSSPMVFNAAKEKLLVPCAFTSLKELPSKPFDSMSEAVDELHSKSFLEEKGEAERKPIERKAVALKHSIEEQVKAREKFEKQVVENRQNGELAYANLSWIEWSASRAKELLAQKMPKPEIMYKMNIESKESLASKNKVIEIKKNSIVIELN